MSNALQHWVGQDTSNRLQPCAVLRAPTRIQPLLLAYDSSKTALNMATVLLARELQGTAIKVNAVSPGYCATDLNAYTGHLSAADGAKIPVLAATLPDDGPSGTFFGAEGPIPW